MSPEIEVSGKTARIAGEALEFFQSGKIDEGAEKLSRAFALSKKTAGDKGPMLSVIAYIGMINDLGNRTGVDARAVDMISAKHTQVCGILEEWAWKRREKGSQITLDCHEACKRYCGDTNLPEEVRGAKEEIGIPAMIMKEFGADIDDAQKTMTAIENCFVAVEELPRKTKLQQNGLAQPGVAGLGGADSGRSAGR